MCIIQSDTKLWCLLWIFIISYKKIKLIIVYFSTGCEESESSADSLLGLTLHYSGTGSLTSDIEHGTGEGEESLEDLLALSPSLATALKLNMALQKNFRARHQALIKELAKNRTRQVSGLQKTRNLYLMQVPHHHHL